LGVTVTTRS